MVGYNSNYVSNAQADNVRGQDLPAAQMVSRISGQSCDNPPCFLQSPTPRARLISISLIYFSANFFFIFMGAENKVIIKSPSNPSNPILHRLKMQNIN